MNSKKNTFIMIGALILLVLIITFLLIYKQNVGLQKVNYDKVKKMMGDKESFVLCISRTTCPHCDTFKPKLNEVAKKSGINIYYIDIDKESENNQEKFGELISFNGETPVTIFVKEGKEATSANRIEGDVSKEKVRDKLRVNGFIND